MSDKRKRLDLDVVRDAIAMERELAHQREVENAEKIANRIVHQVAAVKAIADSFNMRWTDTDIPVTQET